MPIYMDVHIVPGVKAREVAKAHQRDLLLEDQFGCKCMTYWVDEHRETIFCLVDAASKEAVTELHSKAHGMVPNKIIEVSSSVVQSFLGRIYDPELAMNQDGVKVFAEASYRFLVFIRTEDPVLLAHRLGPPGASELISRYIQSVQRNCQQYGGAEAEHKKEGVVLSFSSAGKATDCAQALLRDLSYTDREMLSIRAAINGGEPVSNSNELFGDTLSAAGSLALITPLNHVALSVPVSELVLKDKTRPYPALFFSLQPQEEDFLFSFYSIVEEKWQDSCFDVPEYARAMAMSQSQLYRKAVAVTGESCNTLLKNYRLEKAKALLRKRRYTVAQVTFDCGFTSPSYFTKCFKAQYGLLPNTYMNMTAGQVC